MSSNNAIDHETIILFRASAMKRLDMILGDLANTTEGESPLDLSRLISSTRELLAVLEQSAQLLAGYLDNQHEQGSTANS